MDQQTPQPQPRRLLRSRDDRMIGGVAGGLARYFNLDPILFRIGFAVAVFLGGVGVVAYLAALLFVPEDDGTGQPAPSTRSTSRTAALVAALILALIVVLPFGVPFWAFDGFAGIWIALLVAVGIGIYMLIRRAQKGDMTPGRALAIGLLSVAALVAGGILAIGSAWAAAEGNGTVVAGVVIAMGLVLVIASFAGGARWLIVPALLLVAPASVVAATGFELEGGYGERYHRPASAAAIPEEGYKLAAGELVVDLRDLDWSPGRAVELKLDLGLGEAAVLVPDDVCVEADAHVGIGEIDLRHSEVGGVDVDLDTGPLAGSEVPRLRLDGDVGMGALRVDDDDFDFRDRRGAPFFDDRDEERDLAGAACEG